MPKPVTIHLLADGLSTRIRSVERSSPGPRPTFVLVHGLGMSHRYFGPLQELLSEVGDVHSVDLPGFGANRAPSKHMSVEANAAVLASAIDALDVPSCVLIGHSMGAQFTVEMSVQRPDLVSHLVLIGPVVDPERRSALKQGARLMVDVLLETPRINAIVTTDYLRCGVPWYAAQLRPMLSYLIEDRIALVSSPVLVLRGDRDPVATQAWCTQLSERAANGASLSIPRGAHVVQHNRATEVAAAVLEFATEETRIAH